jgi:hypothetical protein
MRSILLLIEVGQVVVPVYADHCSTGANSCLPRKAGHCGASLDRVRVSDFGDQAKDYALAGAYVLASAGAD